MDILSIISSLLFHFNDFLAAFIGQYGTLVYLLLFVIIFCETGLFVVCFPGDSLIFASGAFAGAGLLNIWILIPLCFLAGFAGDNLNYFFGHSLSERIYACGGRFIKKENVEKAKSFYDRHGGKAIILSRFIPIIRQFTPFVAGIGRMPYRRFIFFDFWGVVSWVGIASVAGYFFGNIPVVRDNFSSAIIIIVLVSLSPAFIIYLKSKLTKKHS